MADIRYVDDEFDDRDMSISGQGFYDDDLCEKIFLAVGRTRLQFKNDQEISKYRRLDDAYDRNQIPDEWIDYRITQAKEHHWSLITLIGAIMNFGKLDEWLARNKGTLTSGTIRQEDKGVIRKETRYN